MNFIQGENWIVRAVIVQLLFFCFSAKNLLPLARLKMTRHSAVLQCLPRARILPPGPRRTARSLNWQETGTICTVMHEAPVTNQHGGKSNIMINRFIRRHIGVHDFQNPCLEQQHGLRLPPVAILKALISRSASFTCGGFIAVFWNNARVKNTNYRKPLRPCTHHEEGIQHLTLGQLKPQLGLIKRERTVPRLPAGNQQMEEVYGSNTPNSSACYFYCLLSTRSWFNTNATYKLQHQDPDI